MPAAIQTVGLIGHPVGHSLSPAMQQAAFDHAGIAARYELWDTAAEDLLERVAALRGVDMLGANVTIPYKTAVMAHLDDIAPETVRWAGAVNTIVRAASPSGVRLIGHNTDLAGLRRTLDEQAAWSAGRRVLILGAGGAAQAALGVAMAAGADMHLAVRRVAAARDVLQQHWVRAHADGDLARPCPDDWTARALDLGDRDALAAALRATTLLINATPVGTRDPDASPLPCELLRQLPPAAFVFDMVYNPPETALVRAARAAGVRAAGGLEMLLYQGAEAFTLWTGHQAPLDIMRAALGLGLG
jgi:shikimate dehydrogenase